MTNSVQILAIKFTLRLVPLILLACTLLCGCIIEGTSLVGRIETGKLPVGSDAENAAKIFILRTDISDFMSTQFIAPSHKIVVDGSDIFFLDSWHYTSFTIAPGNHRIGIKCFGGWSESWKEATLTLQLDAYETYYFKTFPNWQCASINLIDQTEGLERIRKSRHIPFDHKLPTGYDPNSYMSRPRWNIWTGGMQ
ncbi:MAG: hypothetical protein ACOYL3_11115 [Desulfuromonadaceae bacterium]